MRVGSLFAGIGGFDLAARWMAWETTWYSEIDPYASAVMAKHWPDAPNHGDITLIDWSTVEPIDILCGGFPCQDISNAGSMLGLAGHRSGLWAEFARAIRDLRPRYVVVENVAALLNRGIDQVLGDLADLGYDAEWSILSACSLGAPHMRRRLFIVAYPNGQHGRQGIWHSNARELDAIPQISGPAGPSYGWKARMENPSALYRDADGVPNRMDRNRGIGNAIVPQAAYLVFAAIHCAIEESKNACAIPFALAIARHLEEP